MDSRVQLKKASQTTRLAAPFITKKAPPLPSARRSSSTTVSVVVPAGNAIGFVMEYDGLEFPDAIEELASLQRHAGPS